MIARTPNTFVVGAGQVATALAGALRLGGVPVLGLWARTPAHARTAAAVAGVAAFSAAPPDLLLEADVVLCAVRDQAISEVAAKLVATGLVNKHHVLIHCSGAFSAETAFANVASRVGGIATMHPLRSIPDGRKAMRELKGAVFGVEGDEAGKHAALALVRALQGEPLELSAKQMVAYHAAAAMTSNHLVALLDAVSDIFRSAGIAEGQVESAVLPLLEGTLANVRERGIEGALTGPIRRGDLETVRRHLEALGAISEPLERLYRELGLRTAQVARRTEPVDTAALDAIERLLLQQPSGKRRVSSGE